MPRELLDQATRVIPGDGVTPLVTILRKLAEKGYAGPLSVELFLPKFQQGDPFEVAREIRQKVRSRHASGARDLIGSRCRSCASADPAIRVSASYRSVSDAELLRARGLFVAEGRLVVERLIDERPLPPSSRCC